MDKTTAQNYLQAYLQENPSQKPSEGFKLSDPVERSVNNDVVYSFYWVDDSGRGARGGYTYCVLPDGKVILPRGGSAQPESVQDVYSRWQAGNQ